MSNYSKVFILIILLIIGWIYGQLNNPFFADNQVKNFQIKKGENLVTVASHLKREKIIQSKLLFSVYIFLKDQQGLLKAGQYSLSPSMGIIEISQKIIRGETNKQKVTFIEGWKIKDIAQYLDNQQIVQKEDFLEIADQPQLFVNDFNFLKDKPLGENLEGYIFPDTYSVDLNIGPKALIKIALENFGNKLTPNLKKEIKRQKKSIFEILTMASILEKEVRGEEDKKIVSGIFWKRIANNYPLQSCATIAYALGKDKWRYSITDTKIDSPYNTYQHLGLPKGPICNPGLESIKAAIYPKKTDYWYYLSTPQGKTIFSKTLHEHNIARAKYLK